MGCCQNSHCSIEEQITLENLPKQDPLLFPNKFAHPVQGLKIFPNLQSDPYNFYTLFSELSISPLFCRYSCLHSISGKPQDLLVFKKSGMTVTETQNLVENCEKLSNFDSQHIVKVLSVTENAESVFVVTEVCGNRTLKEILENNKIPVGPAFAFARQIMQGLLQLQKLGMSGKSLASTDVFLVKNSLKISISATVFKTSELIIEDLQFATNPEVWCLGTLILQLLNAPTPVTQVKAGLEKLAMARIDTEDLKYLKKMLKTKKKRPALTEVVQYNWNSCMNHSKFSEIEKISEVSESLSGFPESWQDSEKLSQVSFDSALINIEKSLVLQTMESLTN